VVASSRPRTPRSSNSVGSFLDDRVVAVGVNVLMLAPDQTSENGSASSTWPFQPVPSPWTKPCHSAAPARTSSPGAAARPGTCSVAARGDLVRVVHPLDLLLGLDGAGSVGAASHPPHPRTRSNKAFG
jgi:hypothetical protein